MDNDSKNIIIIYYITGHGLGHATRSVGIITNLIDNMPNVFIHIVSKTKASFFEENLNRDTHMNHVKIHNRILDSGAIQTDAIRVDPLKT